MTQPQKTTSLVLIFVLLGGLLLGILLSQQTSQETPRQHVFYGDIYEQILHGQAVAEQQRQRQQSQDIRSFLWLGLCVYLFGSVYAVVSVHNLARRGFPRPTREDE